MCHRLSRRCVSLEPLHGKTCRRHLQPDKTQTIFLSYRDLCGVSKLSNYYKVFMEETNNEAVEQLALLRQLTRAVFFFF